MSIRSWKNAHNGALKFADGTPSTPLEMTALTAVGDFTVGPLRYKMNEPVNVFIRGNYAGSGPGQQVLPTVSFSVVIDSLSDATSDRVADFILALDKYADSPSTVADDWTRHIDITWTCGSDTVVCTDVEVVADNITESTETNTIAFSGTVKGTVTINGREFTPYTPPAA